jgi:uncharacterized damage-inducible protein DinB
MEEVAKQPLDQRLGRLARTADDLAAAVKGQSESALARRPDAKNWAAKEVVCHLRDTEEAFVQRFQAILAMDGAPLLAADPDRWAEERQYARNDVAAALVAFRKRREESLALLKTLGPEQMQRAGNHAVRGRMTIGDFVSLMAWHDDNHLDQIKRALDGRV